MPSDMWINLPVKDVDSSKAFFTSIGFSLNPSYGNSGGSASLMIGDKQVIVMLFPEATFSGFAGHRVAEAAQGSEVLFSIGVDSREAVDEMAQMVVAAGGTVFGEPKEAHGWMYGAGFVDLDGHRWNVLHMDFSKMPKE